MPLPPLKRPPRADAALNRAALLAAARAVFTEDGLDAPVAAISARAGLAKGTFFRHFATKEQLIAELLSDTLDQLASIAEAIDAEQPPGWNALAAMVEQFNAVMAPQRAVILAAERRTGFDPEKTGRALSRLRERAAVIVDRARGTGEVRDDITETDIQLLVMAVTGATAQLEPLHPGLGRRHLRIVLDGLRAPAASCLGSPPISPQDLASARGPGGA